MSLLDWLVLLASLAFIVGVSVYRARHPEKDLDGYILGGRTIARPTVAISIMATQASAITYLTTPGQGYADGMRFVQFYFGLPVAMVVLAAVAVPVYHRLRVYTAYEYLEGRFDLKTRLLATGLFLVQRGLSTGVSIYATALVLSVLLGWNIAVTNVVMGGLVIVYTAAGGARAVAWTQTVQFMIAISGIIVAFAVIVGSLPADVSFLDAIHVAGTMGRLEAVDLTFDPRSRYNVWSGLIGGFFLALSYFGCDQSQVGRYLSGRSITESRLGLLFNGLLKVPMQFFILFLGVMVFVFYQFVTPPVHFNPVAVEAVRKSEKAGSFREVEERHAVAARERSAAVGGLVEAFQAGDPVRKQAAEQRVAAAQKDVSAVRAEAVAILKATPGAETNDTNYVFLRFVLDYLPAGIVGLMLAVVFAASMSSNSAALSALASTTVVDLFLRLGKGESSGARSVRLSKLSTVFWGLFAVAFAMFANRLGILVEVVNILGSLVYPTLLGLFLLAFGFRRMSGTAAFTGGVVGELAVLLAFTASDLAFLWLNVLGTGVVVGVALAVDPFVRRRATGS